MRKRAESGLERLAFVVELARLDLASLSDGDALNLRDELMGFLGGVPGSSLPTRGHVAASPRRKLSREDFAPLQESARRILGAIPRQRRERGANFTEPVFHLPRECRLLVLGQMTSLRPSGELLEMFEFILLLELAREGADRIQECPAVSCHNVFLAEGKRRFCSRACANRESFARWKEKHGETRAAAERDKAHGRYKRKVRSRAPGAKVTRRPRK